MRKPEVEPDSNKFRPDPFVIPDEVVQNMKRMWDQAMINLAAIPVPVSPKDPKKEKILNMLKMIKAELEITENLITEL